MFTTKHIFVLFALLLLSQKGFSQVDSVYTGVQNKDPSKKSTRKRQSPEWLKEKISYGGFINPTYAITSYGSVFAISANPNIGYRLTKELTLGLGATVYYSNYSTNYGKTVYSLYGPNTFARYKIFGNSFLQVEYDKLNQPDFYYRTDKRVWVDYLYIGGGYYQRMTERSGLVVSFMYNLTPSKNSAFFDRMFNIGFVSGF